MRDRSTFKEFNDRDESMSNLLTNIRIARVSTIPFFVYTQLKTQLHSLIDAGAEITVITSNDELSDNLKSIEGAEFKPLHIAREIRLFADLVTLVKLWLLFRKERYQIVHSTTPKAGLLCAIAARLAGVQVRVHTFTGQPWVTMSGVKRAILKFSDKLIAKLNTCCYTDSWSQREFLLQNKIGTPDTLKVIGSGSLAGVNVERFCQDNFSTKDQQELRRSLDIPEQSKILLFVGRLAKEKGIFELIDAMNSVIQLGHDVTLLVVGPFEQNNESEIREYAQQKCSDKVKFLGFQTAPEKYMSISDLLCLPSYREGFGTVVIEAAAMGLPVIATNIYGLTDAVVDGVTGMLIEPKNSNKLAQAIKQLISDSSFRDILGAQAKNRALTEFDSKHCNKLLIQEYNTLLVGTNSPLTNH